MKNFLHKTIFFAVPIVLIFVAFEVFYRIVPNDFSVKYNDIPKKFEKTEILIFGNSHTFYGLNPVCFDQPTYNLAHISQTLYFDKLLFDKYIDSFKNLKCVILHIEYTSLSEIVDTPENNIRKYYYQSYMNLDVPSIKKYDCTQYFLSSTRNFKANSQLIIRYLKNGTIVDCDENGFGTNYTKEKKVPLLKKDALIRVKNIEDILMDFRANTARMQSIINVCKKKNIKVLLLNMPVSNYFAEGVNQKKLKKIQETCAFITRNNDNVSYLNLFKDNRFTNDDFYDADHLHTEGAKKCSKIVNIWVNNFLISKSQE